jgi:hypothetical protein
VEVSEIFVSEDLRREMHDSDGESPESSRRNFLKGIGTLPVMAFAGGRAFGSNPSILPLAASPQQSAASLASTSNKKFIALQIGARSFVDEGVDKCLDTIQEKAAVNVLMPTVFT